MSPLAIFDRLTELGAVAYVSSGRLRIDAPTGAVTPDLAAAIKANRDTLVAAVIGRATGHALALAQIPEFLTRVIPGGPIFRAAQEGVTFLTDPSMTGCVIVTLPETLPVTEALDLVNRVAVFYAKYHMLDFEERSVLIHQLHAKYREWAHCTAFE